MESNDATEAVKPDKLFKTSTKVFLWAFVISIVLCIVVPPSAALIFSVIAGLSFVVILFKAVAAVVEDGDKAFEAELEAAGMTEAEKINARQLRAIKTNTRNTALGTWAR